MLKESTLQAKLRKSCKGGKIPHDTIRLNKSEVVQDSTRHIQRNTVAHYFVENPMTETTPFDFINKVEGVVIRFLGEHLNNKVQLGLICEVNRLRLVTGAEWDVQPSNFRSNQESIYEATNLGEVYNRMRTRILESFST